MFKNYRIVKLKNAAHPKISAFVKKNHYSKSLSRGNKYVFALIVNNKLRGVATFGYPTGKNSPGDLECKRFCLAPGAKKNVASWFMAKCIKQIKRGPYRTLISYADAEQGHSGIMYRASNFNYLGEQGKKGQCIIWNGNKVHLRAAYQKVNGQYTKTAIAVQAALKNGQAKYKSLAKKHIYAYKLRK